MRKKELKEFVWCRSYCNTIIGHNFDKIRTPMSYTLKHYYHCIKFFCCHKFYFISAGIYYDIVAILIIYSVKRCASY